MLVVLFHPSEERKGREWRQSSPVDRKGQVVELMLLLCLSRLQRSPHTTTSRQTAEDISVQHSVFSIQYSVFSNYDCTPGQQFGVRKTAGFVENSGFVKT